MQIAPIGLDMLKPVMVLENKGFARGRWSETSWSSELDGCGRLVLGAIEGDSLVGVASFSTIDDTAELLRVIVDPEHRRRGIGRALVEQGMGNVATSAGATRMLLDVERTNAPAVKLYNRLGFTDISRRKDYYGPGADALIMEKKLA